MRQPHHAGRYRIDELEPPSEALSEEQTEEVKGGSEWAYSSPGPALFGPLVPPTMLAADSIQPAPEAS